MNHEPLMILLAEPDQQKGLLFTEAFQEIKIKSLLHRVSDGSQLIDYLKDSDHLLPHLVFMNLFLPVINGMDCLVQIRRNNQLKDLALAVYADSESEEVIEDVFVQGANIYITRSDDFPSIKGALSHTLSMFWQYHTSGLRKENFLLNINNNGMGRM